jgi:drug/metabolite transporter (DMT)-like permease
MPLIALCAVLLAAATHATWNLHAKKAAGSRHFVLLYSMSSVILYTPIVVWILWTSTFDFSTRHWLALLATGILHLCYSLVLQAGYRASDLSLVYPLARGSGPLISFFAAVILLGEPISFVSVFSVILVVAGILLVSGLTQQTHKAPRAGIAFGLVTGVFIAAYTLNDGWAVKVLAISPFIIDYTGNVFRIVVLAPGAWMDRSRVREEIRDYARPALVVSLLGPLGYILVLYAMRVAPISHVAPARELATLIGTYFGARLLREHAPPARIFGAICIVAGVVGLALAGS